MKAEHSSHTHEVTGTGRITGSPAAEALQALTGDEVGHMQQLVADTKQKAGGKIPDSLLASTTGEPFTGRPSLIADNHVDGSPYEGATDASLLAERPFIGGPASSAAPEIENPSTGADLVTASAAEAPAVAGQVSASGALTGRSALLVAAKPSALLSEMALSLVQRGAQVTIAVKHAQDGHIVTKKLQKQLAPEAKHLLNSTACPVNFASQTSIRQFASAVNASDEQLDMLLLHTVESAPAGRRWYTPEGTAGTAQVGFLGPATLLRLLKPKLSTCSTSVLMTSSPLHRLGRLDDCNNMVTSWAGANMPETQLALLAYTHQLAEHMEGHGLTVCAVDVGPVREQPLSGSLLRKLPPLHQLLHLLLPSAHDTAQLVASIAEDMLADKGQMPVGLAAAGAGGKQEVSPEGPETAVADKISTFRSGTADGTATTKPAKAAPADSRDRAVGGDADTEAGQGPPAASCPSKLPDSTTGSMGAQHRGTTQPVGVALDPAGTAGESASFQAGEALGADIKLLEMLMQQEGETAATPATAETEEPWDAETQQVGEAAGSSNTTTLDGKALAATSRYAEAPAGAFEDSCIGQVDTEQQGQWEARVKRLEVVQGPDASAAGNQEPLAALADAAAGGARKSFRYLSQGLLANPMLTSLDHAGRGSWLTHLLSSITYPIYQLTAGSIVTGFMLMDWPVRAWLLAPAGIVSKWGKTLLGQRAARMLSRLHCGVEGVPSSCYPPQWVEVTPAGLVMDDRLGTSLWQVVEQSLQCTEAVSAVKAL